MKDIRVNKEELIRIIKDNRVKHQMAFDAAIDGYKVTALEELNARFTDIENGRSLRSISLSVPQNQDKEYSRALAMLDMSLDNEVVLPEQDFQQYVMDDWYWKRDWGTSNSMYISKSGATPSDFGVTDEAVDLVSGIVKPGDVIG